MKVKGTLRKAEYSEQKYHNYILKNVNTDINIHKQNFKPQMLQRDS